MHVHKHKHKHMFNTNRDMNLCAYALTLRWAKKKYWILFRKTPSCELFIICCKRWAMAKRRDDILAWMQHYILLKSNAKHIHTSSQQNLWLQLSNLPGFAVVWNLQPKPYARSKSFLVLVLSHPTPPPPPPLLASSSSFHVPLLFPTPPLLQQSLTNSRLAFLPAHAALVAMLCIHKSEFATWFYAHSTNFSLGSKVSFLLPFRFLVLFSLSPLPFISPIPSICFTSILDKR